MRGLRLGKWVSPTPNIICVGVRVEISTDEEFTDIFHTDVSDNPEYYTLTISPSQDSFYWVRFYRLLQDTYTGDVEEAKDSTVPLKVEYRHHINPAFESTYIDKPVIYVNDTISTELTSYHLNNIIINNEFTVKFEKPDSDDPILLYNTIEITNDLGDLLYSKVESTDSLFTINTSEFKLHNGVIINTIQTNSNGSSSKSNRLVLYTKPDVIYTGHGISPVLDLDNNLFIVSNVGLVDIVIKVKDFNQVIMVETVGNQYIFKNSIYEYGERYVIYVSGVNLDGERVNLNPLYIKTMDKVSSYFSANNDYLLYEPLEITKFLHTNVSQDIPIGTIYHSDIVDNKYMTLEDNILCVIDIDYPTGSTSSTLSIDIPELIDKLTSTHKSIIFKALSSDRFLLEVIGDTYRYIASYIFKLNVGMLVKEKVFEYQDLGTTPNTIIYQTNLGTHIIDNDNFIYVTSHIGTTKLKLVTLVNDTYIEKEILSYLDPTDISVIDSFGVSVLFSSVDMAIPGIYRLDLISKKVEFITSQVMSVDDSIVKMMSGDVLIKSDKIYRYKDTVKQVYIDSLGVNHTLRSVTNDIYTLSLDQIHWKSWNNGEIIFNP